MGFNQKVEAMALSLAHHNLNIIFQGTMNSQQIIKKIQEAENEIAVQPSQNNIKEFFIDGKMKFSIKEQANSVLIFLEFVLVSLAAIHTMVTLCLLSSDQANYLTKLIQIIYQQSSFYRIIYALMIVLKVFLMLSIFMQIKENKYMVGITWINQQIFRWFGILKEVDLSLTAYLSVINLQENLAFFVVSCLIYMFHAVYLQNYVARKQLTYASSFANYLVFRFWIVLNYSINITFNHFINAIAFNSTYSIMAPLIFVWYLRNGHNLFHHSYLRRLLLVVASFYLTCYLNVFEHLLLNLNSSTNLYEIAKQILVFCSFIFLFSFFLHQRHHSSFIKEWQAKDIDLTLSILLESSFNDLDTNAELIGLLNFTCIACEMELDSIKAFYDPILRYEIEQKDKYHQKESTLKALIKSIYEYQMETRDNTNEEIHIDYCQFLINYNPNYFQICKHLAIAKAYPLNILQRIKIDRIEAFLREYNQKLNTLIYDGELQLEEIIHSQNCYSEIESRIKQYINKYIHIWSLMKLQEISLIQFRMLLKQQFRLIEQINAGWKKIMKFFEVNKKWNFIYIHYQYFIKNEKIKQKESEIFRSMKLQNRNIFQSHPIYFQASVKESELYNPLLLYNESTCCLTSQFELGQLVIKDVNKRFETITGYCKEEIMNSPLEVIMDDQLKNSHQEKFDRWVSTGFISNQNSYNVKTTHIITKQMIKLPAYKYFKTYFSTDAHLIFFCMLKINLKLSRNSEEAEISSSTQVSRTNLSHSSRNLVTEARVKNHFPAASLDEHIEKNIFIKEQILQPEGQFKEIRCFKVASRLFLVIIIMTIIVLLGITNRNGSTLTSYSNQFINYMNIYRFPMILGTNYMKSFLNVGNITKISQQIQTATASFINSANLDITKATIFDEELNPPAIYRPYYNFSFLSNESHSQIDLFYMMASTISTLSKLPVNQTGLQFQRFISYLKPSYDTMMNTTKFLLHQSFGSIFDDCINNQLLFIFLQSAIFIVFVAALFTYIHRFIVKMRNILYILLDLNADHIHAINSYWKYQRQHFNILFLQFDEEEEGSKKILTSQNMIKKLSNIKLTNDKISLNKRSKQINEDRQRKYFQFKLRVLIVLIMIVILAISVSIEANMIVQLQKLKSFEEAGFFFLKYFPTGPEVTMGCLQKYYADRFPNQISFKPSKYDDVLSSMYIFGHSNNYIGEIVDSSSPYYIKQKNYFFGNPCGFNPAILTSAGITISKCQSMCNGTFKEGLSSFLRYGQERGRSCIYNQVNLTAAQLDEFTLGGAVLSAYVLDAITTWVNEFATKVIALEDTNQIQCIIIIVCILIIHIIINELKIIRIIEQEYQFIQNVYLNLVPESILVNEKVIKQKFIIEGLIRA